MRPRRLVLFIVNGLLVFGAVAGTANASTGGVRRLQATSAATGTTTASSLTATFASISSAHSLLVVIASSDGPEVAARSVTDDGGNAWTSVTQLGFGVDGAFETQIWYAQNAAPAQSVTIDYGDFTGHLAMHLSEYRGVARRGALDGYSTGSSGISGTECSTSVSPNYPNDLAVGFAGTSPRRAMALAPPFRGAMQSTVAANAFRSGFATLPTTDVVTFDATWSDAAAFYCEVVVFRAR